MHAMCLEQLESRVAKPNATVLDVGSGSGYLVKITNKTFTNKKTVCFGRLVGKGGKVIGIDYVPQLVEWSLKNVKKHDQDLIDSGTIQLKGKSIQNAFLMFLVGDGWKGDAANGPYGKSFQERFIN
jgi:protein-L-isoaspartate(D-aspartate) O-methyltransferase